MEIYIYGKKEKKSRYSFGTEITPNGSERPARIRGKY